MSTIYASSCSRSDVQMAINSANDGDTVEIPAGSCTWTSAVVINNKKLTLRGAGILTTIITDAVPKTNSAEDTAIWIYCAEGDEFDISEFTLNGSGTSTTANGSIHQAGGCKKWRIHHMKFDALKSRAIKVGGDTYGVIDHCTFNMSGSQAIYISHSTWNGSTYGDGSWSDLSYLGTEKAVYIEDNTFVNIGPNSCIDSCGGARVVFRHNTVTNEFVSNHGTESTGRFRSGRIMEIYNNTLTYNLSPYWAFAILFRGGSGVVFNNTFNGYNIGIEVANYRSDHSYDPWGKCDGTSSYDGNQEVNGYPCRDQVGRGVDTGVLNLQSLEPLYAWNNTLNGTNTTIHSATPIHIQENRDYYNNIQKPGYVPYIYPHPLVVEETCPQVKCSFDMITL